ncbi:MAG: 50S ribosomal protein L29 [Candidatus Pacebacteria bacterium]|nr:50S ribosomal protein L29 [Candidatus Paceibacterota bacterium]
MKISELKNKNKPELENLLKDNRKKLKDLKFNLAREKVKNPKEIKEVKKTIARLLTLLCQKEN